MLDRNYYRKYLNSAKSVLKTLRYFTKKSNSKLYLRTIKYLCGVIKKDLKNYYWYKRVYLKYHLDGNIELMQDDLNKLNSGIILSDTSKIMLSHFQNLFDFIIDNQETIISNIENFKHVKGFEDFINYYNRYLK